MGFVKDFPQLFTLFSKYRFPLYGTQKKCIKEEESP